MKQQPDGATPLSDALPKWLQVASALRADMEQRLKAGDLRLPTEAELGEQYGVSVVTIRQALASLEARGLITRRRKVGTIIRKEGFTQRSLFRLGAVADLFEQQRSDKTELVKVELISTPDDLKDDFAGQKNLMRFVRRRFTGDKPGNYAVNFVPVDVAAEIDLELLRYLPMSQVIHEHTRFPIGRIEQQITAESADPATARSLEIEPLSATLVLLGRTFGRDERLLDMARITYRGDTFAFVLKTDVP